MAKAIIKIFNMGEDTMLITFNKIALKKMMNEQSCGIDLIQGDKKKRFFFTRDRAHAKYAKKIEEDLIKNKGKLV